MLVSSVMSVVSLKAHINLGTIGYNSIKFDFVQFINVSETIIPAIDKVKLEYGNYM